MACRILKQMLVLEVHFLASGMRLNYGLVSSDYLV